MTKFLIAGNVLQFLAVALLGYLLLEAREDVGEWKQAGETEKAVQANEHAQATIQGLTDALGEAVAQFEAATKRANDSSRELLAQKDKAARELQEQRRREREVIRNDTECQKFYDYPICPALLDSGGGNGGGLFDRADEGSIRPVAGEDDGVPDG